MENASNKRFPDFFKVYLPARNCHRLHIPDAFVAHCGKLLPKKVVLSNHMGKFWHVDVVDTEGGVIFLNGWHKFVQDNSLRYGDFLLFQYNGGCGFYVKPLGQFEPENSGTGAKGTSCVNEANLDERDEKEKEIDDDHDGDDSDDEDYNDDEDEDEDEDDDEDEDEVTKQNSKAVIKEAVIKGGGSKKRSVVKEGGSKQTYNVMVEEAPAIIIKNKNGKKSSEKKGGSTAKGGGFEGGIVKSEQVDVSKFIQPRNPHFITKFKMGSKMHLLLVPSRVLKLHKLDLPDLMIFRNEQGRQWPGNVFRWSDGRIWISGWKDFCTWNNVGLDDSCICEFRPGCDGQRGDILQVHIIRNSGSGS